MINQRQYALLNPYGQLPESAKSKVTSDICSKDRGLLANVSVVRGGLQTTINILLSRLCNELRTRNLTTYSDCDEFIAFLSDYTMCRPGESAPNPRQAEVSNDRGGVEGKDKQDTGSTNLGANAQSGDRIGQTGKNKVSPKKGNRCGGV